MSAVRSRPRSARVTLAILATSGLAYSLVQTMVAPVLPAIQRDYGVSTEAVTWVLTIYLVTATVATPVLGSLGDMFGKRRVLVAVLGAFGVGTLVCALAPSLGVLIAGRGIQGAGGAIFPLAFGIVRDELPLERVSSGIGLIAATYGIGAASGFPLAGVVTDQLDYVWIFWLTLAVVVVAAVATHRFIPESPTRRPAPIDWLGVGLLAPGLGALLLGISQGTVWGWGSARTVVALAGGTALLLVFAVHQLRAASPLIDLQVMRIRAVWTTNLTSFVTGFGMFGTVLLVPQFVQIPTRTGYGLGASVTEAGLFLVPSALALLFGSVAVGPLAARFGRRMPVMLGAGVASAAFLQLALLHSEVWHIYVHSVLSGLGVGLALAAMAALVVAAVPQSQTGTATSVHTITRWVGSSLNAPIAAGILGSQLDRWGFPTEPRFVAALLLSAGALALAAVAGLLIPPLRPGAGGGG